MGTAEHVLERRFVAPAGSDQHGQRVALDGDRLAILAFSSNMSPQVFVQRRVWRLMWRLRI